MRRMLALFVVVVVALLQGHAPGAGQPKEPSVFMQLKLKNSQTVLEGLALNDFKRVETGAEYLWMLSRKAEFQHLDTPEYKRHSAAFGRIAETSCFAASVTLPLTSLACRNVTRLE